MPIFHKTKGAVMKVCVVFGVLCAAPPAWAHAKLLSSTPAADGVVPTGPLDIALSFSEPVTVITCKVVDKAGKEIPGCSAARSEGAVLHIPIGNPLAEGEYSVGYRVAGPDTHPVQGAFNFRVQAAKR